MSHREDTGSRTEADAQRAEAHRVQVTGEDTDTVDGFAVARCTWKTAEIPQHVWDDIRNTPRDAPPF